MVTKKISWHSVRELNWFEGKECSILTNPHAKVHQGRVVLVDIDGLTLKQGSKTETLKRDYIAAVRHEANGEKFVWNRPKLLSLLEANGVKPELWGVTR